MCFDALADNEVAERPTGALLRGEALDAVRTGVVAAALVAFVLYARGVGSGTLVPTAAAAVVLGAVFHQAVFLAGVGVLRLRRRHRNGEAANVDTGGAV